MIMDNNLFKIVPGLGLCCAIAALIVVTTNLGESVELDADHPLTVMTDPETLEPSPYVRIRGRLDAKLTRSAFYELVSMAEEDGDQYVVRSNGQTFEIGPMSDV